MLHSLYNAKQMHMNTRRPSRFEITIPAHLTLGYWPDGQIVHGRHVPTGLLKVPEEHPYVSVAEDPLE